MWELTYSSRSSVHYHGARQHADRRGARAETATSCRPQELTDTLGDVLSIKKSNPIPKVTRFLLQGHTHSTKLTPPNSVTPFEIMEASYIQTFRVSQRCAEKFSF